MRASIVAGSLLSGLVLIASPLHGQQVSASVLVRSGPVAGHVVVADGYSTYQRPPVVVYHRPPVRRVVVVERYAPRVLVVERVHRHRPARYWKRHGFRPITLYYLDGRYYDRPIGRAWDARQVVVYEREGRYYADCDDRHDRRLEHRHDNWDD